MKTLLMIGAGLSQAVGITLAKKMGYKIVAIDGDQGAIGLKLADASFVIDVKNKKDILQIAKDQKVDGVFSVASDICLETVAWLTEKLNLPGLSRQRLLPTVNKGIMREMLSVNSVPGPSFFVIESKSLLRNAGDIVGFPAVMKPVDSAGSRGVSLVRTRRELADAYLRARSYSSIGTTILEEFMAGPEISVEAFVIRGNTHILTLSDKDRTDPPYLLDTTVKFPSTTSDVVQIQVREIALLAIKTLGIDNCPVHMEIILTSEGPKVVEMAARGPGFKVYTDIIPHVTGVNGIELQIRLLSGQTPNPIPRMPLKGACVRFFGSKRQGIIENIRNVEEVASLPGVSDLQLYVKPGDMIRKLTCGSDRLGHVITLSDTRDHAVSLADYAFQNIKIELKKEC